MTTHHFLKGRSPGVSLIIGLVLVGVITLFSIGVTNLVIDSIRQGANVRRGTEAYYAAEAGIEQGLMVNQILRSEDRAVGASKEGSTATRDKDDFLGYEAGFKIIGTAEDDAVSQINGKYIVPFPWTGDVPWTGDGSKVEGGCDPENPPQTINAGTSSEQFIYYDGTKDVEYDAIDHPCNWGMIKTGQKVTIPLYDADGNYTDFIVKLRTPCPNGEQFCAKTDRVELNCYDKGEMRCVGTEVHNKLRGEVSVLWQIDGQESQELVSLIPYDYINTVYKYYDITEGDSQLFEAIINAQLKTNYEVLDSTSNTDGKKSTGLNETDTIDAFIRNYAKPTLKLSVVGDLTGCNDVCAPDDALVDGQGDPLSSPPKLPNIPYLEYQVVFGESTQPSNIENIIRADGTSGPFSHSLEVKVPHDTSSLEYVIQQ